MQRWFNRTILVTGNILPNCIYTRCSFGMSPVTSYVIWVVCSGQWWCTPLCIHHIIQEHIQGVYSTIFLHAIYIPYDRSLVVSEQYTPLLICHISLSLPLSNLTCQFSSLLSLYSCYVILLGKNNTEIIRKPYTSLDFIFFFLIPYVPSLSCLSFPLCIFQTLYIAVVAVKTSKCNSFNVGFTCFFTATTAIYIDW
jgi:hypothetical protein